MKLRYVLLILFMIFYWLGYNHEQAVKACKAAGVHSDETCEMSTY